MSHPLVSVCIPCHNAERYISPAVYSVLGQSWKEVEVIVVDDRSTDGSRAVLDSIQDPRLRVISADCGSAPRARNLALDNSTGAYIKFFDADDIISPGLIEKQMQRIGGRIDAVSSSEWGRFFGEDLGSFRRNPESVWRDMNGPDWLVESWQRARPMCQPGMFLIPREIIESVGAWDVKLADKSPCDDFEFFARVLSGASEVLFTSGETLYYRSGIEGSLSKRRERVAIEGAYHSLVQGTSALLSQRDDCAARKSCANVLQNFIYTYYPDSPDLLAEMSARVQELGGADIDVDGPPRFKRLKRFLGWKIARRLQLLFGAN